jgi:hypothetical protein
MAGTAINGFTLDNRRIVQSMKMRLGYRSGYPHYLFSKGGKRFLYCYVRKNASSAFKALILDEIRGGWPVGHDEPLGTRPIDLMDRAARARYPTDMRGIDHGVFVYRDPFVRIASLYLNKFVQRRGSDDILASYREVTGERPESASLSDFVHEYLRSDFHLLDLHVLPQRRHMWPIVYTDVVPIHRLHERMSHILGAAVADRYFRVSVNETSGAPSYHDDCAADRPAEELCRIYAADGRLPSVAALLSDPVRKRIAQLYREDLLFADADAIA